MPEFCAQPNHVIVEKLAQNKPLHHSVFLFSDT